MLICYFLGNGQAHSKTKQNEKAEKHRQMRRKGSLHPGKRGIYQWKLGI